MKKILLVSIVLMLGLGMLHGSEYETYKVSFYFDSNLKDYVIVPILNKHEHFKLILVSKDDSLKNNIEGKLPIDSKVWKEMSLSLIKIHSKIKLTPYYKEFRGDHFGGITFIFSYPMTYEEIEKYPEKVRYKLLDKNTITYFEQTKDNKCKLLLPSYFSPDLYYLDGKLYYVKKQ